MYIKLVGCIGYRESVKLILLEFIVIAPKMIFHYRPTLMDGHFRLYAVWVFRKFGHASQSKEIPNLTKRNQKIKTK